MAGTPESHGPPPEKEENSGGAQEDLGFDGLQLSPHIKAREPM